MPDLPDVESYLDPAPRSRNYDNLIRKHATRAGVDENLVRAIIGQESSGKVRALSPKGAGGLMQLMPGTAQRFGVRNVYDPDQNIRGGTDYLKFLSDRYGGNVDKVLAGYNAGEGAVDKFGGIPPYKETRNYVPAVKARYARLTGQQAPSGIESYLDPLPQQQTPQQPVQARTARPVSPWGTGPIGRGVKPTRIAPRGISAARVEGEARPSEATATRGALRNIAASAGLPTGIPSAAGDLINEAVYQGAGQLLNAAGGVGTSRLAISPITSATEYLANRAGISPSRILKQGARQIAGNVQAVDEDAKRGVISSTAKDLIAGSIGSSPAMILTALGVPAPVAFGLQSNLEAEGSDASFKDVVKETAKGATIGALFELPLPVKQELLTTLQQRLLRAGIVGSGTAALTGSPTESLINAAFGGMGGKGRERTTETRPEAAPVAEPIPEAPQAQAPEVGAVTHPKLQRRLDDGTYGKETKAETEARRAQVESATPEPAPEELIRPPEAAPSPAELPPEAATTRASTAIPPEVASVPFMVTRKMRADLGERGYSKADIDKMTPQQANEILAQPVRPETTATPPEIKTPKLALGVEAKAVERKLTEGFSDLPEYDVMRVREQAQQATDLLKSNPERAHRIAMGTEDAPQGLRPEAVFTAVENRALEKGDVETLQQLASSSTLPSEATAMGQRIRLLGERNPSSAVAAIRDVQQARESRVPNVMRAKKTIHTEIKVELRRAAPKPRDWASFLETIKCK